MSSAQQIWRTKLKSCKKLILQTKKGSPIHNQHPNLTENSIVKIEKHEVNMNDKNDHTAEVLIPSSEMFSTEMGTVIETRLSNIEKRAQQIIRFIVKPSK